MKQNNPTEKSKKISSLTEGGTIFQNPRVLFRECEPIFRQLGGTRGGSTLIFPECDSNPILTLVLTD